MGKTATGGYQQLVFATVFDPDLFEIVKVETAYTVDDNPVRVPNPNYQVYADGCLWDNDITSATYRSCLSTGKVGSTMSAVYTVKVVGAGTSTLTTEIYDFSGSSYHYNADFGAGPTVTTVANPDPCRLTVSKAAAPTSFGASATTIDYTVTVSNTSGSAVTSLSVTDPMISSWSSPWPASIPNGQTESRTGTYTIVPADRARGYIDNLVTVTGRITGSDTECQAQLRVTGAPSISLTKSATPTTYDLGDTIDYEFDVTNDGGTTLIGLIIEDAKLDAPATCDDTTLASGASTTCRGSHVVTQSDIDAGTIINTARAVAIAPGDEKVRDTATRTVTGPTASPALAIVKEALASSYAAAGEVIQYRFIVANTGNVTVDDVAVEDSKLDSPAVCAASSLAPGEEMVCVGRHTVTTADMAASTVSNSARATGTPKRGVLPPVTPDKADVPKRTGSLSLVKTAAPTRFAAAGDRVTYRVVVTNTSQDPISRVTISDDLLKLSCDTQLPAATLLPGTSITCIGYYTVTQSDVDAGQILNTASAAGTDSGGNRVSDRGKAAVVGSDPSPSVTILKSSTTDRYYQAGQVIPYAFTVTNTGNITVRDVAVTDSLLATAPVCPDTPLAPGESMTCTGSYTVTTADLARDWIINTARVSGTPDRGTLPPAPPATEEIPRTDPPALRITKAASPGTYTKVGDTISYTLTIRNTGGSSLTNVTVTDPQISGLNCSVSTPATLGAGSSFTCTGSHVITQADIDSGMVPNTATVDGKRGSDFLRDRASKTVIGPADVTPSLSIVKRSRTTSYSKVGDAISYTFTVTNNGDLTMSDIEILDAVLDAPGASCPKTVLAPARSMTCTGQHTVTAKDLTLSAVSNSATVRGLPPRGSFETPPPSSIVVPKQGSDSVADLAIRKSGPASAVVDDRVSFVLTVSNNGPDTAVGLVVTDSLPTGVKPLSASGDGWDCEILATIIRCSRANLKPDASAPVISIRARLLATARPAVTNSATVQSTSRDLKPVNNTASASVKVERAPQKPQRETKIRKDSNTLIIVPGKSTSGEKLNVVVTCTERLGRSGGRSTADFCQVRTRDDGTIAVRVVRTRPVGVTVTSSAPGSDAYKPYTYEQVFPMGAPLPDTL